MDIIILSTIFRAFVYSDLLIKSWIVITSGPILARITSSGILGYSRSCFVQLNSKIKRKVDRYAWPIGHH